MRRHPSNKIPPATLEALPTTMTSRTSPKVKQIPSWQQDPNVKDQTSPEDECNSTLLSTPDARAYLLEKATKFLKEDDIKDAPIEKKRTFLQSKSLTEAEVAQLLSSEPGQKAAESQTRQERDLPSDTSMSPPTKDQPPIITYPEFLLHSQKPPPLITAQRLMIAIYIVSGAAAAMYGTSKYLVEPMIGSLSSARHSFFENASAKMSLLNEKLETNISRLPASYQTPADGEESDADSTISDGAHFFSRTAGTQTTPRLSRSQSISSCSSAVLPPSLAITQSSKLADLRASLDEIKPSDGVNESIKQSVGELTEYLRSLASRRSPQLSGTPVNNHKEDSTTKMKSEIRGLKGVLLSARNFPSSAGSR